MSDETNKQDLPVANPETPKQAPVETPEAQKPVQESKPAPKPPQASAPVGRLREENTIFIGKKGVMGYVLAVVTQFNNGSDKVKIKARGKLISRAVDVAEIVRHRFMPDAKVKNIEIKTEDLQSEDGSHTKVSSIEIELSK